MNNFFAKIEKEFEEEIDDPNFRAVNYRDKKGELRKMYELTYEQSLQLLMGEFEDEIRETKIRPSQYPHKMLTVIVQAKELDGEHLKSR